MESAQLIITLVPHGYQIDGEGDGFEKFSVCRDYGDNIKILPAVRAICDLVHNLEDQQYNFQELQSALREIAEKGGTEIGLEGFDGKWASIVAHKALDRTTGVKTGNGLPAAEEQPD